MISTRRCTRTACGRRAVATLTFVYVESTAVLGPLSPDVEPGTYDLCHEHAEGLRVPQGWDVIRLAHDPEPAPSSDDLEALAAAVRAAAHSIDPAPEVPAPIRNADVIEVARRGHLTVLTDPARSRR
ncbi:MAG: DUF3499 domain-containing protein [Propionibacteriaceae bacterium]